MVISEALIYGIILFIRTVQVLSSHRIHSDRTALPALTSKLVTTILERISKLYMMKVPASFVSTIHYIYWCLLFLGNTSNLTYFNIYFIIFDWT